MKTLHLLWKSRTFAQVFFVLFVFAIMIYSSYSFSADIVQRKLAKNAEYTLNATHQSILNDFKEAKTALFFVSEHLEHMIAAGHDSDEIREYLLSVDTMTRETSEKNYMRFYTLVEAYNNDFITGDIEPPGDDYIPQERPWHRTAQDNPHDVGMTDAYIDSHTGRLNVTFTDNIYDGSGERLAVVCVDLIIDSIIHDVLYTYIIEGSRGMIIDSDFTVLAHENPDFVGRSILELSESVSDVTAELIRAGDVRGLPIVAYDGIPSIAYFKGIDNGWFLGVVTTEEAYYKELVEMRWFLILLGAAMALILSVVIMRVALSKGKADEQAELMRQKLGEADERTRTMVDFAPFCTNYWYDINNPRLIDCNLEAARLFEVASKDEYLERFGELSPEFQPCGRRSSELAAEYVKQAFEEGYLRFEWSHQKANGEPIPTEITLVRTKQKDEYVVIGYTRDLREFRKMLDEMRKSEIAIKANNAKSEFIALMSHEMRTPMNAILGITEIQLQREGISPQTEEAWYRVYNSGYTLLNIINDVLDLSRIESGKLTVSPVKYDILNLINDTVNLNIIRLGSKQIEFEIEIEPTIPLELYGDELRIKQIMNNLLSNAFKYTEKGKVVLSVSSEQGKDVSVVVLVFKVSDTGIGMTPQQLDSLFEAYSRFNPSRTTEGTGLGMSITQQVLNIMSGEIHVESNLGAGSIFTVRVPQVRVSEEILGEEEADNLKNFRSSKSSRIKRITVAREPMPYGKVLIVDDVDTNVYVAQGLLAPYRLKIDTASSGFEAIEKVEKNREYDIIFMDHMMPKMDGVEAVRHIRKMGFKNSIVALTANAVAGQAEMFMRNGFDDFISKPIDIRQLNTVLNKLIRDKYPPQVVEAARNQQYDDETVSVEAYSSLLSKAFVRDAEKAIRTLDQISNKSNGFTVTASFSKSDLHSYVIAVHSMKNALLNIGENELSDIARCLEEAGRNEGFDVIASKTSEFLGSLKKLTNKLESADEPQPTADSSDTNNNELLREKLSIIKEACEKYDNKTAETALSELRLKKWEHPIKKALESIYEALLHSEFEQAAEMCDEQFTIES